MKSGLIRNSLINDGDILEESLIFIQFQAWIGIGVSDGISGMHVIGKPVFSRMTFGLRINFVGAVLDP